MESNLIYSAGSHNKRKAKWSEWIYCGVGEDIKADIINNTVSEYFKDSIIYIVTTRKESGEIKASDVLERIKNELAENEIFIWDTGFKKVIEFNTIGVMRNGIVPTVI